MVDVDAVEIRVLGCLSRSNGRRRTLPLSLNALRLACNQATNRDPVMELRRGDDPRRAGASRAPGWTRLASGPGSRAAKYRQLFDEALRLSPAELSVLTVLMLRGAQTPGELKTRTERLYPLPPPRRG